MQKRYLNFIDVYIVISTNEALLINWYILIIIGRHTILLLTQIS